MNPPEYPKTHIWLRSAAELGGVALLVFGIGLVGVWLAAAVHRTPVRAGRGGLIELRIARSDRQGDVTFMEANYAGWWHCRGNDWAVQWQFQPETDQPYNVGIMVATPERTAGETLEAAVQSATDSRNQVFRTEVPDTGGAGRWQTLDFGSVLPVPGVGTLTVRPGSAGLTNLNIKRATLRPIESTK